MNRLCVRTLSFEYFVEKYTGGKKTEIRNCVMWINAMRTPSGDTGFTLHYQQPDYGRTYSFILFTYLFIIRKAAVDQRHFLKRSALRRGVKCYTFSRRNKNKPDHSQESTEHNSRVEGSKNICRTFMDWMNCQYKNTTTWCRPYFKLSWLRNIADPKFWNGPIRSFHRQLLFSIYCKSVPRDTDSHRSDPENRVTMRWLCERLCSVRYSTQDDTLSHGW